MHYLLWLSLSAVFFAIGEYWSKKFANEQRASYIGVILAAYLLTSIFWLPALVQKNHLAVVGTVWSVITLMVTILMGVVVFGERLSGPQWLGVGLATMSIVLLNLE